MTNPEQKFSEDDIRSAQKYLVLLGVQEITLDIVTVVTAVERYNLFTEEGTKRLGDIVNQFFKDLSVVLQTEKDIESLRSAE
jgi:hypothetical protein